MSSEFEVIERYFTRCGAQRTDVPLGVGDDAALLHCLAGKQLVAAIDTLVAGRHFLPTTPARSLGHRALAVNLSDLAAMGATPAWCLLALTLPRVDEIWLQDFASGLHDLAQQHELALVGGDTTAGSLCITVQILGHVEPGRGLRRQGASPGDVVYVSGTCGDAAAGLKLERGELLPSQAMDRQFLLQRFHFPTPRVALGQRLQSFASACIDVSDGLLGDAAKLAAASGCGVRLDFAAIPISEQLENVLGTDAARQLALVGGDDYELCFTVPASKVAAFERELPADRWQYQRIGELLATPGAAVHRAGTVMPIATGGYDHFSNA
jgi:thiamine-monophosphate kinase